VKYGINLLHTFLFRADPMDSEGFFHEPPDTLGRIKGCSRILENGLDLPCQRFGSPQPSLLGLGQAIYGDGSFIRYKPQYAVPQAGFTAARFPHKAKDLPLNDF
jgi:hypothetical protein